MRLAFDSAISFIPNIIAAQHLQYIRVAFCHLIINWLSAVFTPQSTPTFRNRMAHGYFRHIKMTHGYLLHIKMALFHHHNRIALSYLLYIKYKIKMDVGYLLHIKMARIHLFHLEMALSYMLHIKMALFIPSA